MPTHGGSSRNICMTIAFVGFQLWQQLTAQVDIRRIGTTTAVGTIPLFDSLPLQDAQLDPLDTGYERFECIPNMPASDGYNLPIGIVAGTMKGGTQSLMKFLLQHPRMASRQPSEMHILSNPRLFRNSNQVDVASIHAKYHDMSRLTHAAENVDTNGTTTNAFLMDKSPEYLLESHVVPQRVVCVFGNATKVVIVLRNPVDRTISNYHHKKRHAQSISFPTLEEMIQQQVQVLQPLGLLNTTSWTPRQEYQIWSRFQDEQASSKRRDETSYGIVARSLYHIQIRQWLAVFRDAFGVSQMRNHLLILDSEQLKNDDKTKTYQRILEFLGLPSGNLTDSMDKHKGNYAPVAETTRQWLEELYAPSNQQLKELLEPYGLEMSWTAATTTEAQAATGM